MELRQLATFRVVATTLNFTRAAAALGYVQSSVTAQIQALEEDLGVPLFDRLGRRVALTEAGRRLLDYAEKVLDLAEEARTAVTSGEEVSGSVTIGAPETLCTYRLPAVLSEFRSRYPRVRLVFRPMNVADLPRYVAEGVLDVAFVLRGPLQSTVLRVEPLRTEPLLVLAATGHPLVEAGLVAPPDLAGEPLLLTEAGCSYRGMFTQMLEAAGVGSSGALEFGSVEAIKQCVIAGLGITVLPAVAVEGELAQKRLAALQWSEPGFAVQTQMLWHKDKWLSPALSAFLELSRRLLRGDGPTEPK